MTRLQKFMTGYVPKSNKNTLALIEKFKKETILLEIAIGKILGDGSILREGNLNFCQSIKQKEYIEHCYELFSKRTSGSRKIRRKPYTKKGIHSQKRQRLGVGNINEELSFYTKAIFKDLLPIFYTYEPSKLTRTKILPKNLEEMLTFRSLAYWIMDDGAKQDNNLMLCTHSFSKKENEFLINILENKFKLDCKLKTQSKPEENIKNNIHNLETVWYYILITNVPYLWSQIKTYIIPSMYYKFGLHAKSNN